MATPTWASAPATGNQNGQHAIRYEDGKQLKRKQWNGKQMLGVNKHINQNDFIPQQ